VAILWPPAPVQSRGLPWASDAPDPAPHLDVPADSRYCPRLALGSG